MVVAVCLDAGWGDPGYVNRWTLEVYNLKPTAQYCIASR